MFKDNLEQSEWEEIVDHGVWLRLAKIQAAGVVLGCAARTKLGKVTQQYSHLQLADDESDEFPFWMETGETQRKCIPTPRRRRELVEWLKKHSKSDFREEDDWHQRCSDNFPTTACALCALTKEDCWPVDRWREALQAWSESKHIKQSWRYMGPVLGNASDEFISSLAHGLSWWLKTIAKTFNGNEDIFLNLCRRVIEVDHQNKIDTEDPVGWAINHPVGLVTDALLGFWYRNDLRKGQGLPEKLKIIFTQLCDTQTDKFRPGRVVLATHGVNFYHADPDWTSEHLLPLFDWQSSSTEACLAWEGFLRSPRLHWPLLNIIKGPFLQTAEHYEELGDHAEQYADFLAYVALDRVDSFTKKELAELAEATKCLPLNGLARSVQTLIRMLVGAGDQRSEYWANRVAPYIHDIWPKSRDLITPEISRNLAHLCIAAVDGFPDSWEELRHWIKPVEHHDYVVHSMYEAKICKQFPEESLAFLNTVVGEKGTWHINELQQCLGDIEEANQQLAKDDSFIRLTELIRKQGGT